MNRQSRSENLRKIGRKQGIKSDEELCNVKCAITNILYVVYVSEVLVYSVYLKLEICKFDNFVVNSCSIIATCK